MPRKRQTARKKPAPKRRSKSKKGGRPRPSAAPAVEVPANWDYDMGGKAVSLELETRDFLHAVALVEEIARVAEDLEHHPDVHITKWNHLKLTSYSHDVGRLTERDRRLTEGINRVLARHGLAPA